MRGWKHVMLVAACLAAGCTAGEGAGGGGAFTDDGGTGTGTLRIIAALSVDETSSFLANVAVADEASQPVTGASVVLGTPDQGDIALVEEPAGFGIYVLPPGAWDWTTGFSLDVDAGAAGNAAGIGFAAPDLTQVTSPQAQDTLPLGQAISVTWLGRGADEHRLRLALHEYDSGWVAGDDGAGVIPAAVTTTAGGEALTVNRRKEIAITAGRPGSAFTAELEDVITPIGLQ